jgi:protein tyrosine phosphatase (PTP) superfamily phosphohydrolase (DUF442 family)
MIDGRFGRSLGAHLAAWGLAAIVGTGAFAASRWNADTWAWDHFDVVKPGVMYRSGQLTGAQLESAVLQHGIRTVVNFLRPGRDVEAERAVAKRLGVDFLNLPMPGDGFGREEQFREVLEAIVDPERRPVLVHCARGTCRTGAAVALYRYERDGWTVEDVSAEMRRQTYRQGWLAGYVYQMVEERPFAEIFTPTRSLDVNRPGAEATDGD